MELNHIYLVAGSFFLWPLLQLIVWPVMRVLLALLCEKIYMDGFKEAHNCHPYDRWTEVYQRLSKAEDKIKALEERIPDEKSV